MSDETTTTTNQSATQRSPTHAKAKSSGGVFSWLTGSRSPTHGTATTVRSNASGSPHASGNVSPARTASPTGSRSSAASGPRSPASASRSPSRSPPRSPARRFVIPALAMGMGGGGRGPAVMMDIGSRAVYVQSDDEEETVGAGEESTITSTTINVDDDEMKLPPSVHFHTKTISGETVENQVPEPPLTVRSVAFFPSEDNQTEETNGQVMIQPTTTVRYVHGDHQHTPGASHIITTTTTAEQLRALPPLASPSGLGGIQSVRYIAKSAASPAHSTTSASPGRVRYISKTMTVDGGQRLVSPAAPSPAGTTNVRFFGSPLQQPQHSNVHYVTRVVNGQSVQVPVPVGAPSHDHRVQYVRTPSPAAGGIVATTTTTTTTVSPSSSVTSTKTVSPTEHQHQHVRYIAKSAIATQPVATQPNQVQYVTTRTVAEGETATASVPLSAVVASTVAGHAGNTTGLSPAHHVPASLLRLDSTYEGLPSRHFRGIALTDTDSSDGEDADVKMVFDIMLQKFVPVPAKRRRRSSKGAASAATAAAVVAAATTEAELEEKTAVPVADEGEEMAKSNGVAIGLAAVGAAAVVGVAVAANATPSPMMKLDTVAAPSQAVVAESPSGLKKRTPSQTKPEPSPRVRVSLDDVALDMDASPAQYAELRSPTSNHDGMPDNSRLGHIGMSLKLRVCRWLLITLLSLAVIVFLMILFYKGVALRKFKKSEYSYAKQNDLLDNYNSYVGVVASLFSKPIELLIAIVVPILFFSFVAKALLGRKLSPRLLTMMFALSSILGFLLSNGFHGINVQMRVMGVEPIIALNDLSLTLSAAAALSALVAANASSNASNIITEGGVGNAITNTVLRGVISPPVDDVTTTTDSTTPSSGRRLQASTSSATPLLCSNTFDYRNVLGTSDLGGLTTLSTTTVATYGFPLRGWQEQMLPGAFPETNVTITLDDPTSVGGVSALSVSGLPMRVRTAANLFLHSAHIARDVFGWFSDGSSPLSVEKVVNTQYTSSDGKNPTYVPLVELMNLTVRGSLAEETLAAPAFVSQVRSLFNQSLAGAANISQSESTLEFSSVTLPNGYAFDSVTMEIPLAKSFLSRRLTAAGSAFAEAKAPTNETDVFYDLDIANDCGPYASACEVRRTEYDAAGRVYEPPTTIRTFAMCNNSLGNDDLEVFFNGAQTKKSIAYTCNGKSDTGMLVVSVSSRIVGDALIEGPSPLVPRLVAGMATLKNPRKIYSLTVGKLSWSKTNLAVKFHAACSVGLERCTGLDYALTAALENATEALSSLVTGGSLRGAVATALNQEQNKNKEYEYLIVGSDFLPLRLLPTFAYNATETPAAPNATATKKKTVSGYPLVTITKPLQGDSLFQNDGDLAAAANFKNVSWKSTTPRSGASCSATVEARLNSVLNNHYYMDRGVQPAYTAAMYFLFQDAVTRTQIALAGGAATATGLSTLRFASTVEFMELHASIPLLNVVLTLVGCGFILIVSLLVAMRSARGKQTYSATEGGHDDTHAYAPPESFARVKLDRALFPAIVMKRRVVDMTASPTSTATETTGAPSTKNGQSGGGVVGGGDEGERIDSFTVGAVRLEHDNRDVEVDVPYAMGK